MPDKATRAVKVKTIKAVKEEPKKAPEVVTPVVVAPTPKVAVKDTILGQEQNKKYIKIAIKKNIPTLLVGETGTGKTSMIREQALLNDADLVRFSITGETTVDEFVGKYELDDGKTVWHDGVLLDAMKKGKWLVCDEVNVALPEILFVLHSLLDDDRKVTVTNHLSEVIVPHDNFRFFATMNPPEEYAGTKELNKAFASRFGMILEVDYPEPKVEVDILTKKTGVDVTKATVMVDVATALRKAKKEDKIFYTCSTRDLIHWATLANELSSGNAFTLSVLNKASQDKDNIVSVYKDVTGKYIKVAKPASELNIDYILRETAKLEEAKKNFEQSKEAMKKEITKQIVDSLTEATNDAVKGATDGVIKKETN